MTARPELALLQFVIPRNLTDKSYKNTHTHSFLRRRFAGGEGIVSVGVVLSRACVSVCMPTARRINLGGEGNALYPVFSS